LGCVDQIEALAVSHAVLNGRSRLCDDDMNAVKLAESYLVDPLSPNTPKIKALYQQGLGQEDICTSLGMTPETYHPFVSKVLGKACARGIIG